MNDKPNYYAIIPASVRYSNLKPNAKLLYGEITALSGKLGYCYATNNYFAELYGVSKNTISRWISDLNKLGFINIEVERNEKKQVIKRKIGIIHKDDRAIYKMSKENTTSINYWTEGKKKMRYQKQSTFEIKLRLLRWSKNQKKWDKPKQKTSKIDSQLDEYLKGKELL